MKAIESDRKKGLTGMETTCNGFNLHRDACYKFRS
jgi:hypothetical protein